MAYMFKLLQKYSVGRCGARTLPVHCLVVGASLVHHAYLVGKLVPAPECHDFSLREEHAAYTADGSPPSQPLELSALAQ